MQCASSVASLLRNLRRAGVLKNSSLTSTSCPGRGRRGAARRCGRPAGRRCPALGRRGWRFPTPRRWPPAPRPESPWWPRFPGRADRGSCWWHGGAGPRAARRGNAAAVVFHRDQAHPRPAGARDLRGAGVQALSTSSRTTEAGRSTTSPAAIWLISSSGRSRIAGDGRAGRGSFR
jgi:hypothetical protein